MAQNNIKQIRDQLVSIAEGITETSVFDGFKNVFGYEPDLSDIDGDPICIIRWRSLETGQMTTSSNERKWGYTATILLTRDANTTESDLENHLQYATEALIHEFEKNYTNQPYWIQLDPVSANVNYSYGGYLASEININVSVLTDITS